MILGSIGGLYAASSGVASPAIRTILVYPKTEATTEVSRSHVSVVPALTAAPVPSFLPNVQAPAAPGPVLVPTPRAGALDEGVAQALHDRQAYQQAQVGIDALNPLSTSAAPSEELASPEFQEKLNQLHAILRNPAIQSYLKLMSDKKLQEGIKGVMESRDLKTLAYAQLGFFVLYLFMRSIWIARAKSMIKRIWVSIYTAVMYLGCSAVVIPVFVLGECYSRMLKGLWSAVSKQLL